MSEGAPPCVIRRRSTPGQGGLGLGLALVLGLARQHGGDVTAHSEGAGRGAEFRVTLPLAPPDEAAVAGDEADRELLASSGQPD